MRDELPCFRGIYLTPISDCPQHLAESTLENALAAFDIYEQPAVLLE